MKIIFLDFDGVIRTTRSRLAGTTKNGFDPIAGRIIEWIATQSGAKYVLCTSWREGRSREELETLLIESTIDPQKLHHDHSTPILRRERQTEIEQWLALHPEVTSFCVVDDGIGFDESAPWLVQPDIDFGVGLKELLSISKIFNINPLPYLEEQEIRLHPSELRIVSA